MQITDSIFDPELGCTAFTVERITYTRSRSGTTSRSTTAQALGCIHPGMPWEQGDGSFRNPKGNEMGCPRRSLPDVPPR